MPEAPDSFTVVIYVHLELPFKLRFIAIYRSVAKVDVPSRAHSWISPPARKFVFSLHPQVPAQQIEPSSKSAPKSDWERVCLQHVTVESGCSELDDTLSTFSKDEDLEQLEKTGQVN